MELFDLLPAHKATVQVDEALQRLYDSPAFQKRLNATLRLADRNIHNAAKEGRRTTRVRVHAPFRSSIFNQELALLAEAALTSKGYKVLSGADIRNPGGYILWINIPNKPIDLNIQENK